MDSVQLFNLLKNEQEQTIALILSHLPPERAAEVSTSFDEAKRVVVLERLATLAPTPSEIVDKVIAVVLGKAQRAIARPLTHPGGVLVAAAMLNAMNKEASKNILTTLEESNPDLGNSIKQKMFTFEDLIYLDAQDVQKILRDVDMKDLALAMKNVPENLVSFILSCMSKRAGEGVLEEMEFLTNAKAKDIEAAQLNVVETVRRLESDDEIDLSVMGAGGMMSMTEHNIRFGDKSRSHWTCPFKDVPFWESIEAHYRSIREEGYYSCARGSSSGSQGVL